MCMIIDNQKGYAVSDARLAYILASNPDGYGMIDYETGKHFRTMSAAEITKRIRSCKGGWMLHARISTGGTVSKQNCHPYPVGRWLIAMNGVLSDVQPAAAMSDTKTICQFLPHMDKNKVIQFLATFNRVRWLAFDRDTGDVSRLGNWVEDGGVWYSHRGYCGLPSFSYKKSSAARSYGDLGDWRTCTTPTKVSNPRVLPPIDDRVTPMADDDQFWSRVDRIAAEADIEGVTPLSDEELIRLAKEEIIDEQILAELEEEDNLRLGLGWSDEDEPRRNYHL